MLVQRKKAKGFTMSTANSINTVTLKWRMSNELGYQAHMDADGADWWETYLAGSNCSICDHSFTEFECGWQTDTMNSPAEVCQHHVVFECQCLGHGKG